MATITPPKNKTEADAMEMAMASYRLQRAQAVQDFLDSDEATAFEAKLIELVSEGLPAGTTTAGNIVQLPKWFTDVRAQAVSDLANLNMVVNPPAPPSSGLN